MTAWLCPAEWKATLSPRAVEQKDSVFPQPSGHSVLFVQPGCSSSRSVLPCWNKSASKRVASHSLRAGATCCAEQRRSSPDSTGSLAQHISSVWGWHEAVIQIRTAVSFTQSQATMSQSTNESKVIYIVTFLHKLEKMVKCKIHSFSWPTQKGARARI